MSKKIVGLVPSGRLFNNKFLYDNNYIFVNNYIKRINEIGGIPVGVLPSNGYIKNYNLEFYDAFIIEGGSKVYPYHLQIIDYAIKNNKPLLGICLGMQAIYIFFEIKEEIEKMKYSGSVVEFFKEVRNCNDDYYLEKVEGHTLNEKLTLENIEKSKHLITLNKNSIIYNIFKQEKINMPSLHSFRIKKVNSNLKITGIANDGTSEVIEYGDNILGVQFHPENEVENNKIFKYIIEK